MDGPTSEALATARSTATDPELRDLVWAMAVPVLVADYTPLLSRYAGCTLEQVTEQLDDNAELLGALDSIGVRALSAPWALLYGVGGEDVPGLAERLDSPSQYPHLKSHLVEQLSAPWSGVTSLVHEHAAPTSGKDRVIVQSHWNVTIIDGSPDWSRVDIIDLDVTDLRTAEHNLVQADRLKAIGSIAAGVAHELNTPLQYVSDNLHFIAQSIETLGDLFAAADQPDVLERFPQLSVAVAACDLGFLQEELPLATAQSLEGIATMAGIVLALKEFSHAGSGDKESSDLNHLVTTAVAVCRNEWKNVAEVELDLDRRLPRVAVYPQEVRQVILNLVVNAAHAIRCQGRDEPGRIHISTKVQSGSAVICVSDDGGGVPEALRERIFDPFFTTKDVGEGTGQGLAIARKSIAGRHGGRLDLEVDDGVGSSFIIKLPLTG